MRTWAIPLAVSLLCAACGADKDLSGSADERLLRAAKVGQLSAVQALLAQGADLEAQEKTSGWTPLIWMAAKGHSEGVRFLCARGARKEARGRDGLTALMAAARWGKQDAVAALVEAGAQVDARDGNGWTALMWASLKGQTAMVGFLLAQGADPESRDKDGRRALMLATSKGHEAAAAELLRGGASRL